jgi:hypothetical protein
MVQDHQSAEVFRRFSHLLPLRRFLNERARPGIGLLANFFESFKYGHGFLQSDITAENHTGRRDECQSLSLFTCTPRGFW